MSDHGFRVSASRPGGLRSVERFLGLVAMLAVIGTLAPVGAALAQDPGGSSAAVDGTDLVDGGRRARRVLLVSIDGLRADAVNPELAPRLVELMKDGSSTLEARSQTPTRTVPNHVSMVTGLTPARHGFVDNFDQGQGLVPNTVFELARNAGFSTGVYVSKKKLRIVARVGTYDRFFVTDTASSQQIVQHWIADVEAGYGPELSFVHLREPDTAGHGSGWMGAEYRTAVRRADSYVRSMLAALERAGLAEETLVIVTADHGGSGHDHSGVRSEDARIPWIAAGPGFPVGEEIPVSVGTHDTAPTMLRALGVEHSVEMDGVAVQAVFAGELPLFVRGDANGDGAVNLTDAVHVLGNLYVTPDDPDYGCEIAADVDGSDSVTRRDALYLLYYLFRGRAAPVAPFPEPGMVLSPVPCAAGLFERSTEL